jgi:predicted ribosome quality control (RQC) complex YloA/Tae2 family protein
MDQKREMTSVDLAALVAELREYEGAVADKAYLYGDDLVRLKLRDFDRGRVELLLEVGEVKRAHVARPEHVPEAPGRPPDFAKMLRNRMSGANLADVRQFEFDRILEFEFRREDQDTTLVVELFGEGNVAVLDQNGEVVDSLETVRLKSRTVAPGSRYEFPSSRLNPLEIDEAAFAAKMRESDTDLVRTLATQLNFGGLYGEEICTRAGVEKAKPIADADEDDYARLYDAMERLFDPIRSGDLDPRVYYASEARSASDSASGERSDPRAGEDGEADDGRRRVDVTPVPLEEHADLESEAFDSFGDALDDYFTNLDTSEDEVAAEQGPDFDEQIAKKERIIAQQEGAIESFEEEAEVEREKAELLYGNYDLVDDVLSTVREAREAGHGWADIAERFAEGAEQGIDAAEAVKGVNEQEGTVRLELDGRAIDLEPQAGVEKNADRLYTEAKRIEEKKAGALDAIEDTREELEALRERKAEWEAGDGEDADDSENDDADVDWLSRASIPVRKRDQWYERFRWFRTSDGFLVIGGRSADQNEELVDKYMDGYDLFFHSQAHGGPATVLKTSEPSEPSKDVDVPEASKRQAAQFAVSYGSVWKDGRFSGDVYQVSPDQVTKTPESGEYLAKGSFAIRGDRTYFRDTPVGCAVGVKCEPETRVVGGPPDAIEGQVETMVRVEPGRFAQADVAKRVYREFRDRFTDETFVRKVASADKIGEFMPPGGSRIVED